MSNNFLTFISDDKLIYNVKVLLDTTKKLLTEDTGDIFRNSIDPFSAVFDSVNQKISLTDWMTQERMRQNQKTFQNAVGIFHQEILGSFINWKSLPTGGVIDVKNDANKIVGEIKNKWNTTNSSSAEALYDHLNTQLKKHYLGYVAYHVQIVPKNGKFYNKPYAPSGRDPNEKIRVIDGKSFYALASGNKDALKLMYFALPKVINKITGNLAQNIIKDKYYKLLFEKVYG